VAESIFNFSHTNEFLEKDFYGVETEWSQTPLIQCRWVTEGKKKKAASKMQSAKSLKFGTHL